MRPVARNRTRRLVAATAIAGLLGTTTAGLSPAAADPFSQGFSVDVTATPLKIEVFEPSIPIPTDPQFELGFSYTRVQGEAGPSVTARASAMWPGPAIGEGLKTFGEQLGLPEQLTGGGYPVQSNARFPGEPSQAAGEPLPGMVQRVNTTDVKSVAMAGYTGSGTLQGGEGQAANPLEALQNGDLSALGGFLTGSTTGSAADPVQTNPLGAFSLLVDFDGMTSVSSASYEDDKVVSTATSRIGELRLLTGIVKLTGVNVVTTVVSTLEGGAVTSQKVDIGGMTIAGQKFAYGPEGFEAAGSTTATPALPLDSKQLMELLGLSISVPKPTVTKSGTAGRVDAEALTVTLDLRVLHSKLPALPLDDILSQIPPMPGQAGLLNGLLLTLDEFAPKLVLHLGQASARAETIAPLELTGETETTETPAATPEVPVEAVPEVALPEAVPEAAPPAGAADTTDLNPVAAIPGLPPLGSIPGMLMLLGLVLASLLGWYLRRAGATIFGAGAACTHGLKSGVPDLRKA